MEHENIERNCFKKKEKTLDAAIAAPGFSHSGPDFNQKIESRVSISVLRSLSGTQPSI
jgi:hypothetical protein